MTPNATVVYGTEELREITDHTGPFVGFVGNNKNTEYHQPYPLML